jgi:hypothetical protein
VTFAERARVAAVAGGLVALGGGAARAADPGIGLGLSFNAGPAVFQTVRTSYSSNLGTTDVDTTLAAAISVAGTMSMGPVVAGLSVDGTYAVVNFPHAFAGGFLGAELKLGKVMVQLAAEGGEHLVVNPGADWSHTSTAPSVLLPYFGGRLRVERLVRSWSEKGSILVGVSAFYRHRHAERPLPRHLRGERPAAWPRPVRRGRNLGGPRPRFHLVGAGLVPAGAGVDRTQ